MTPKKKKITINAGTGGKDRRFDTFKRRTIYIFSRLAQKGFITTKELAEKFEMTPRNALRDLDPLREQGILKENITRSGRWEFDTASNSFIKMEITDRDSSTLAFLYNFAKVLGGDINEKVLSVLDKVFPMEDREYPFFMITQKVKNPAAKMPCHQEIYDAIQTHHKINLTYRKETGPATVKASPFSMIICDGLWYLGYVPDGKDKELRTVRSSHIISVEPLPDEVFARPEWAHKAMKGAKNIWFSPAKTKFLLKVKNTIKDYFEMSEFFPEQKITDEGPEYFTIEARYSHYNEVVPNILRFLPAITVLEPAELKAEVAWRVNTYKP